MDEKKYPLMPLEFFDFPTQCEAQVKNFPQKAKLATVFALGANFATMDKAPCVLDTGSHPLTPSDTLTLLLALRLALSASGLSLVILANCRPRIVGWVDIFAVPIVAVRQALYFELS
jgi:hypothetical protein